MSGWYILESSFLLSLGLILYRILLSHQTTHRANRWMLLSIAVSAFVLPVVDVVDALPLQGSWHMVSDMAEYFSEPDVDAKSVGVITPEALHETSHVPPAATPLSIRTSQIASFIAGVAWPTYLLGAAVMLLHFLFQLASRGMKIIRFGLRNGLVETDDQLSAHSFFHFIFIGTRGMDPGLVAHVLAHERIHAQQGHSMDRLMAEAVLILQWFNPFAWQFRREVALNLEYLTDRTLLSSYKINKSEYQMNLLKVAAPGRVWSVFNHYGSYVRKRIVMMERTPSERISPWRYFTLLPVIFIATLFFPSGEPVIGENVFPVHSQGSDACRGQAFTVLFHAGSTQAAIEEMVQKMQSDGLNLKIDKLEWDAREADLIKELSARLCCADDCVIHASLSVDFNVLNRGGLAGFWSNGRGFGVTTGNTWEKNDFVQLMEDLIDDDSKVYASFGPSGLSRSEFLSSGPFERFNDRFNLNKLLLANFKADRAVVFPGQPVYDYFVNDEPISPGLLNDLFTKAKVLDVRYVETASGKNQIRIQTAHKPLSEDFSSATFRMGAQQHAAIMKRLKSQIEEYNIDPGHQHIYIGGLESNTTLHELDLGAYQYMKVVYRKHFTREGHYSHISMNLYLESR